MNLFLSLLLWNGSNDNAWKYVVLTYFEMLANQLQRGVDKTYTYKPAVWKWVVLEIMKFMLIVVVAADAVDVDVEVDVDVNIQ